jgi:ABC-type glycerol-3-phosphate transport system permease component
MGAPDNKAPVIRQTTRSQLRTRVLRASVTLFLIAYSAVTLFPFYVLFVRTFVGTKDAAELHLWIPPATEVSMNARIGNLSVFYNLDIKKLKADLGIPQKAYIGPQTTLAQISDEYGIPPERIRRYLAPFATLNGWILLFSSGRIVPALARTIIVSAVGLVGLNLLSICTGYALAGLRRRDQVFIYNLYLLQMVIPPMLVLLPQYLLVQSILRLVPGTGVAGFTRNASQIAIVILLVIKGGALSTMIFTSFIGAIPRELEECSEIDGANRLQYLVHILLPLLKVPMASLSVIMLPVIWNDFLAPYVYLDPANQTLIPMIQSFSGQYTTNYQVVFTATFVSILPLACIYLVFRRFFIRGLLAGAIKG